MKILFIAPLPPPVHGSAMVSQYIKDSKLVNELHDCDFVNLSTSRRMDEIGKGGIKKLLRFIGSYFAVFFKLLTHRYDLCYLAITCHGVGFLKDAPFVLLCKLFGRKVLIHQHNKGMSGCVDRWPYRWLMPLVYRNTKVMLLSWYLYPDIERVVSRDQVVICPNGIPDVSDELRAMSCALRAMSDEKRALSSNENENCHPDGVSEMSAAPSLRGRAGGEAPNLLFLSNLIPSKGVYVLLDACRILKERGLDFACDFVGGETKEIDRTAFEAEVKARGLESRVVYHGPQYGEDKLRFFQQADVFVQPTFNDCFPLTLVEAMQYSLPIVSTDVGAIPDMVVDGENGFVCEQQDVASLVTALEKLIVDPTMRRQMGEQGYARYREKYTLEAFEECFVAGLKSCER